MPGLHKDTVGFLAEGPTEIFSATNRTITGKTVTKEIRLNASPMQSLLSFMQVKLSKRSSPTGQKKKRKFRGRVQLRTAR